MAMKRIVAKRSDVLWSYLGTIFSQISGFLLLPFLVCCLSEEELGLWYVYIAISNLALLFEFGFSPTFARNIVYVVSGARSVPDDSKVDSRSAEVDWHLLRVLILASKIVFAGIAVLVLAVLAVLGSAYLVQVVNVGSTMDYWASWGIFCASIALNLFFYYSTTILTGYGDVAGVNKIRTASRVIQLLVSIVLLFLGMGLVGAALGYMANSLSLRFLALIALSRHKDACRGVKSDVKKIRRDEIVSALKPIGRISWRDGIVQLSLYCSTQTMALFASAYLGLAESGAYSILLQLGNAICSFAGSYNATFYPSMQSAYAVGDVSAQKRYASTGIVAYWFLVILSGLGAVAVVLPVLSFVKPEMSGHGVVFVVLVGYLALSKQHSIFCNYIIGTNRIPYVKGYLMAAILGVILVAVLCGPFELGVWGILLGQFSSQVVYNNWKWPIYYSRMLNTSYRSLLAEGVCLWLGRLKTSTKNNCAEKK